MKTALEAYAEVKAQIAAAAAVARVAPALTASTIGAPVVLDQKQQIAALTARLPEDHKPYTDKYFLRTTEILRADGLNPWVRAQVFIRKGPGEVYGINETLAMIGKYTKLFQNGGRVLAKNEGERFEASEPLLFIEGPVQDIIEVETMILGALSRESSKFNDGIAEVDLTEVEKRMGAVVQAAEGRPVMYAGARHWGWEQDRAITVAALAAGAQGASTDIGTSVVGLRGQGTIPHALEVIYAWKAGREKAVCEATQAFDRAIDPEVKRIALVDFNNREIDDALATARAFATEDRSLFSVRVDTCGENIAQGAIGSPDDTEAARLRSLGVPLPPADAPDAKYWYGKGVTVTGVLALRRALDEAGFPEVKITLSSGFGKKEKVEAFVRAEKLLGVRLFDALLAGEVWSGGRIATMDLVAVGEGPESLREISKTGRPYRPNDRLTEVDPVNLGLV